MRDEKPYSILPDMHRSLAVELRKNIKAGQTDLALNQLDKLATSLGERINTVSAEAERNRLWTIMGALLGAAGIAITTVIFLISTQFRKKRAALGEQKSTS